MALCERLEIYIPVEAEVKSILLSSLPNSILRRIGLSLPNSNSAVKLPESLKGTWICPAVIRRKGQKVASHTGNDAKKEFVSLMGSGSQDKLGPQRLSFVSSNRTAYKLLKATKHENAVSAKAPDTMLEPQDSSPQTEQDALVIYNGQIYLSIKNPNRTRSKRKMCDPKEPSQSGDSPNLDMPSKSQKEVLPDKETPVKQIACKVPHIQNTDCITENLKDTGSSLTPLAVTQSTDSVHRVTGQDAIDEQTTEKAAVQEPDLFEDLEKKEEELMPNNDSGDLDMQDLDSKEAESLDHISNVNFITTIPTIEDDQGSTPSWTIIEPEGASISLQNENEFNELAQDEMIARMKARLKEKEAALNNRSSL